MPSDRACAGLEEVGGTLVVGATVDEMDLGVALGSARSRVNVVTTEVFTKFESIGNSKIGKVLGAESDDLALGNVVREFILAGIAELGQLNTADLATDAGSQVGDLRTLRQEVGIGCVGVLAMLLVLEGLERTPGLCAVPCRKIVDVL